jgi:hypothetical protein
MKEYTFLIFIFIWLILVVSRIFSKKEIENYFTIIKNKKFIILGDRIFYSKSLMNFCIIIFYITFGFTELKIEYFILHILILIFTTLKFRRSV